MKKTLPTLASILLFLHCFVQISGNPGADAMRKKLDSIIIPKINFQMVTVGEAAQFLQHVSKKYDPERKGVKINLIDVNSPSKVTLRINKLSLHKTLELIGEIAGLSVDVEADGVRFRKQKSTSD